MRKHSDELLTKILKESLKFLTVHEQRQASVSTTVARCTKREGDDKATFPGNF